MSPGLLLDNSAWQRITQPRLPPERAREITELMASGGLVVCLPFLLEAGYSAQSADDHAAIGGRLARLARVDIDPEVEARALRAQSQLVRAARHRLPPMDLILAALADRHDLGVLHYDGDFDVIAANSDLTFDSVWLAPRGSLD